MKRKLFGTLVAAALISQVMVVPASAITAADLENCFVQAINAERSARGIDPLEVDTGLVSYARQHTQSMISAGSLYHSTSAQLAAVLPEGKTSWGENVGYAANCARLHRAFMESPGHKKNILDPGFTRLTIGAAVSPSGSVWATEIFYGHPDPLGLPPFWDDNGSPYESDIIKLAAAGITGGCGDGRFCPDAPLTRAQMAVFLARALGLRAQSGDFFTDDDGSPFEAEINAIAAAGITTGCNPGRFCPDEYLSRAEMASFVTRAFDLPASAVDYFSDDDGNLHESGINALAAAGITTGCSAGRFCPGGALTRGQMATFLVRALGW